MEEKKVFTSGKYWEAGGSELDLGSERNERHDVCAALQMPCDMEAHEDGIQRDKRLYSQIL